ncbi:MAG: site-specific integrase [Nitratireductor sp.]|nr:site-specific integrase [Nitratireductor sp.]
MPSLTKRVVDAITPTDKPVYLWDDELRGFGLQILPSGTKSFVVQYRNAVGRSRRLTIGRYGTFTPDEARKAARDALHVVARGGDPVENRQALKTAPTVADLLDRYLSDHVKRQNAATTQAEVERLVDKHVRPRLGVMKVAGVTTSDIAKLHLAMAGTPRQANFVLSIISKVFNLAEVWGMRPRSSNPVHGINRYAEHERERFLSAAELGRLGETLAEAETKGLPWMIKAKGSKHLRKDVDQRRSVINGEAIAAIRLLLFTGARLSEVLSLRWDDIDLRAGTIALPSRKGGGRRPHPINAAALAILADLPRVEGTPWVFPRQSDTSRHLSKEVMESTWQRVRHHAQIEDVRLHDLRHTVGTFAGQAGGNAFIVRDLLRHRGVAMTGRYVNADVDPIRAMSDLVGERIAAGLKGGDESAEIVRLNGHSSK